MAPANGRQKPHFVSKEKIHEEDPGNGVDGSNRARLRRSGEGGERSMLRFRRLLCLLRRVLEAGS
jgi:hypothetical protein